MTPAMNAWKLDTAADSTEVDFTRFLTDLLTSFPSVYLLFLFIYQRKQILVAILGNVLWVMAESVK